MGIGKGWVIDCDCKKKFYVNEVLTLDGYKVAKCPYCKKKIDL